jgi:hypothetical protein
MARLSGSLARSSAASYAPADNARNWGTGVDPGHQTADIPDLGTPPPIPYAYQEVPPHITDMVNPTAEPPYYPEIDQDGTTLYGEAAGHDVPTLPYGVRDDDTLRQLSGRLHSQNRGGMRAYTATKVDRDWTTRNESRREQSLGPTDPAQGAGLSGNALRALRGRNSLAVNNPGSPEVSFSGDYVRQGWDLSRITERRMDRRGLSHTKRELHLNLATTAVDTPPHPGPYSSPFRNFADLSKGAQLPWARREPRPWDEDTVSDGSEQPVENFNSWGL